MTTYIRHFHAIEDPCDDGCRGLEDRTQTLSPGDVIAYGPRMNDELYTEEVVK